MPRAGPATPRPSRPARRGRGRSGPAPGLRSVATAALAAASGVRRSWPTAASSAVRVRSTWARVAASAACARRAVRSSTRPLGREGRHHRWSSASSRDPRMASTRCSPAGTTVWVRSGSGLASAGPAAATTLHGESPPPERSSRVTDVSRRWCAAARACRPARRPHPVRHRQVGQGGRLGCRPGGLPGAPGGEVDHELTSIATAMNTNSATALLTSLTLSVCSGGVKK